MLITDSTGALIALAGIGPQVALAEVTMRPSITYDDVTLTFSELVPTCELAGGRPAILTHLGDVVITNDTPTAANDGDGWLANGAMWNPYLYRITPTDEGATPGEDPQGFDGSLPHEPARGQNVTFDDAVCVSPSYSGNGNLTVAQGQTGTFVKSVRNAGHSADYNTIEKFVPFTFLDAVPVANAVRPSMAGLDKSCTVTPADFDYSVFRSLAKPASMASIDDALAILPKVFPAFGLGNGEALRLFHNYPVDVGSGYAGAYGEFHAELWSNLHTNISDEEKAPAVLRMVEWARDVAGMYSRGWRGFVGAGQNHGIHETLFIAAFVLQDSDMLAIAQDVLSNMYSATWSTADDLYLSVGHPSTKGSPGVAPYTRPYFDEDLGKPMYTGEGEGASLNRRYLSTAGPAMFSGTTFVMGLQDGPGSITGVEAIAQSSDLTTANPLAAAVAYPDRYRTWIPDYSVNGLSAWMKDFYDTLRPELAHAMFTCSPDTWEWSEDLPIFSAGAGSISWDMTGLDYNGNLSRTDIWVRYSIDQVSFIEANGKSTTGSITGLNQGVPHYCQFAFENSAGKGFYTPNYPLADGGSDRDVVTPTGTASNAAPSWSGRMAPSLFYRPSNFWAGPYYLPVDIAETPSTSVTKLTAGVGYPSGYPAPTVDDFTYQWQRNSVDISGATDKEYNLTHDDLSQDIRCSVTMTTTEGTASMNTDAVTIYSYPTLDSGVIWETPCDGAMDIFWPEIMENVGSVNADNNAPLADAILHIPDVLLKEQVPTASLGGIWLKKTGGRQVWSIQLGPISGGDIGDCVSGTEYTVTFNVLRNAHPPGRDKYFNPVWTGNLEFSIGSDPERDSDDLSTMVVYEPDDGVPKMLTLSATFTPASTGPVYANFVIVLGTGGVGGDVIIDNMTFEEV